MKRYLMGLDIGTSGTKCILADPMTGEVRASAVREYPLSTPTPGWAEQDPEDWYRACCDAAKAVMAKCDGELAGVSFSGQMHGLVALDGSGRVIRPSILWCDQRTQEECDEITRAAGGDDALLAVTNNRMLTGYTGGKILWLKKREPENYAKMRVFVCPKDYIRYRLTGEIMTDVSDASGTGFYDTRAHAWAEGLIRACGLDVGTFPPVVESSAESGRVTERAAAETGIPAGTMTYAGGGDAVIQSTGAGLVLPGDAGVVIGTAGNVSMALDAFRVNPKGQLQMFCNNAPETWTALGCTISAGGAYRWYRDVLCRDITAEAEKTGTSAYDIMGREAEASRPGSNGVLFAPYLSGERIPYPDPLARGVFYGLSLSTQRGDMTRAVMEGVTFSLCQCIDILRSLSDVNRIFSSGGGSRSKLWRQMQADVFGLPVYTMSASGEGGAYGAVMVAAVGAGIRRDLGDAASVLRVETETLPDPANRAAYEDAYGKYCMLYPALEKVYHA